MEFCILDVLKEINLTPDDLKKFNKIMRGGIKIPNSIHSKDSNEIDYEKVGFGYGGPSWIGYKNITSDRPYVSEPGFMGSTWIHTKDSKTNS